MNGAQSYILCRERLSGVGVCVDFSGTDSFNVENLQIIGGASAATAPKVTVLLGKTRKSDGTIANGSEISWFSVTVKTHGAYGVYDYGGEVWNCHQCYFTETELRMSCFRMPTQPGLCRRSQVWWRPLLP
jgi:hypothetical protein